VFRKCLKFIGIYLTLFMFLSEAIGLSYAAVTMNEMKAMFEKKTGKKWEQVTGESRRQKKIAVLRSIKNMATGIKTVELPKPAIVAITAAT